MRLLVPLRAMAMRALTMQTGRRTAERRRKRVELRPPACLPPR
jgi:hypothetical protein